METINLREVKSMSAELSRFGVMPNIAWHSSMGRQRRHLRYIRKKQKLGLTIDIKTFLDNFKVTA